MEERSECADLYHQILKVARYYDDEVTASALLNALGATLLDRPNPPEAARSFAEMLVAMVDKNFVTQATERGEHHLN